MVLLKNKNKEDSKRKQEYSEIKKELIKNKDSITIELVSLSIGEIFYVDSRTKEEYSWVDSEFKIIPLNVVLNILNDSRKMLESLALGITNVYIKDNDLNFTLEDVINGLGLSEIYAPFDYDVSNIDGILIDSTLDEFTEFCNRCPNQVLLLIVERMLYLSKEGYLHDSYKEEIISSMTNLGHVFKKI